AGLSTPAGESEWIEGRVERVLWAATDGGWAVLRVSTTSGSMVVVGALGAVAEDCKDGVQPFASFEGRYEEHASHGRQFRATGVLLESPRAVEGLRQYLGSGGIRGIGASMANRIVYQSGMETTRILEEEPARLAEVPGVG